MCLIAQNMNNAADVLKTPKFDDKKKYIFINTTQNDKNIIITIKDNGIIISMDGKGRATDNICIERFWRSAKVEKIYLNEYFKVSDLKNDVSNYMQFYNYKRFHETLNYKKPMNVYWDIISRFNK